MNWSESCWCVTVSSAAYQRHMMVNFCCESGSTHKLFCRCFLHCQEANELILNAWLY